MASLIAELKRRNVFKVGVAYTIVAWLIAPIISVVNAPLNLPERFDTAIIVFLLVCFPVALIFAWAFELTPEGIKPSKSVNPTESITRDTGQKLNYAIIALLSLAVVFLIVDNYVLVETPPSVSADRKSIAVLPFANRSNDENDAFFVGGIHDDILTQLAKISSLKVISRTSVMEYRDSPKNMRTIGEELGVATILEGGVQRAGDTIRINVQLIDAGTDEHLWAENFDRDLTAQNIFVIQSEIATSIAKALQTELTPQELAHLNEIPTQNTRAHDFYLIGKEYRARGDLPLAEQMFKQAVEEDPEFALAWAELSIIHARIYWESERTEMRRQMAFEAVQTALKISPNLPEAHSALGTYYYRGLRDYGRALQEFAIAEQGMPGEYRNVMAKAFIERRVGQWDESLRTMEQAIEIDPRSDGPLAMQGETYLALHNYDQAENYLQRAIRVEPDSENAHYWRTLIPILRDGDVTSVQVALENPLMPRDNAYYLLGWHASLYNRDFDTAIEYLDEMDESYFLHDGAQYQRASLYGVTYQLAEDDDLAQQNFQVARRQIENLLELAPDDARFHITLGEVLAGLGENESAVTAARHGMELLSVSDDTYTGPDIQIGAAVRVLIPAQAHEAAIQELDDYFSTPRRWSIEGLLPDPRLDPIRDDPRFVALVEKYKRK
jgi:TolB-like protein/Tfp pilus assembly protein PilF